MLLNSRSAGVLARGRSRCSGARRRDDLGDYYEFERFSVGLELHFILVEGELNRRIYRNEGLVGWLRLTNGVFGGAGANDILLAKEIDFLLLGLLCAARDRGLGNNGALLRFGSGEDDRST